VLLALPLIALGGYSIIAAGAGLSLVRWIKTAENATDYSLMNTARQLLWLPTTREEKYKAKQAIDTFFVRGGDVLSAGVVYAGTSLLHLTTAQFASVNIMLTLIWIVLAVRILYPHHTLPRVKPSGAWRRLAAATAVLGMIALATPASAQDAREAQRTRDAQRTNGRLCRIAVRRIAAQCVARRMPSEDTSREEPAGTCSQCAETDPHRS
jgi:hypothetical protein